MPPRQCPGPERGIGIFMIESLTYQVSVAVRGAGSSRRTLASALTVAWSRALPSDAL